MGKNILGRKRAVIVLKQFSCEDFRVCVSYSIQKLTAPLARECSESLHFQQTTCRSNMLWGFVLSVIQSVRCSVLSSLER